MDGMGTRDCESDERFMADLYRQYERLIYKVAWDQLQSEQFLNDVVDETVICLCRHVDTLRRLSEEARMAYICAATRNTAVDYLRQEFRQSAGSRDAETPEDFPDRQPEPLERLVKDEESEYIQLCLSRMNKRDRQVLRLRYFDDRSAAEIAKMYGVTPTTIRNWLRASRKQLRQMLEVMENEK